jgi:hypothetical protein
MKKTLTQHSDKQLLHEKEQINRYLEQINIEEARRKKQKHLFILEHLLIDKTEDLNKKFTNVPHGRSFSEIFGEFYSNFRIDVFEYSKRRRLHDFVDFYRNNIKELIRGLLFDKGFANSDNLIEEIDPKIIFMNKNAKHYLDKTSHLEVLDVLIKYGEKDFLSGDIKPHKKLIYASDGLPFQRYKNDFKQPFKFNFCIDSCISSNSKKELTEIRDERLHKLFLEMNKMEQINLYAFFNTYNYYEILNRKRGLRGNSVIINTENFIRGPLFSEQLEKFLCEINQFQTNKQLEILKFMAKEPAKYMPLLTYLTTRVREDRLMYHD